MSHDSHDSRDSRDGHFGHVSHDSHVSHGLSRGAQAPVALNPQISLRLVAGETFERAQA